jgi:tetratricopeptide (TPR) repeat protein
LENLLHPLPIKRFVALLSWPKTSDAHVTPMLTSVLNAIKSELTRLEPLDKDLFVISPEDMSLNVAGVTHLKEVCDPLGANLVLAASGLPGAKHFQLFLRLLDPSSSQPLREKKVTCALAEITALPSKAVQAATSLLDLSPSMQKGERPKPGTRSTAAFIAFQSAESFMKQPSHTGLDTAIEKYTQAVELDPHYAIAHARLSYAYGRLYMLRRDPAALDLARANCAVALTLDPDLAEAHLAQALISESSGSKEGALKEISKSLSLDPSDPRTLVWQALIYTDLNRWEDAEKTFHRVLKEHPNYWLAYNELGYALHGQGRYEEAIQAFRAASLAAPGSSVALINLGQEYLHTGEFVQGTEALKQSLARDPYSDATAAFLSFALRCQGKYAEALSFARKAVELNPALDTNWLELGDSYSCLRNRQTEAKNAYLRAAKEAEKHLLTDAADAPGWMLLALYKVKSGSPQESPSLIERAESLGAQDIDSQLYKARILELLGKREEALAAFEACFRRGASDLQVAPYPDLQSLRRDPRYKLIVQPKSPASPSG